MTGIFIISIGLIFNGEWYVWFHSRGPNVGGTRASAMGLKKEMLTRKDRKFLREVGIKADLEGQRDLAATLRQFLERSEKSQKEQSQGWTKLREKHLTQLLEGMLKESSDESQQG